MQKLRLLGIFMMLLVGWSCTEEDNGTIVVATEQVIFVSGDKARLLGRLITNQPVKATDHGFYLSTEAGFSSPVIVSLGAKEGPGRFLGETEGLKTNTRYFAKAFVTINGEEQFGESVELTTLSPVIESFSPTFSIPGGELVIEGRNFPSSVKVFFGNQEATILSNTFESRLRVRIPAASGQSVVPIRVQILDKALIFEQKFEYRAGKFTLQSNFPGGARIYENVAFQNQEGFFAGLGAFRITGPYEGFQRFNPAAGTWSAVSFPGVSVQAGFATSSFIGGGGVEIGRDLFEYSRQFWRINGSTFQKLPDLPFNSFRSIAFEANGQLFLGGGIGIGARSMRRYSPQTGTWATLAATPIDLDYSLAYFTYQNKAYFIATDNNLWEYNPATDSWRIVTRYPGPLGNGYGAAVVLGDKAFVGLYRRTEQLWELDLKTLVWKSKNNIPGLPQSVNVGVYTANGQIFYLRAPEASVAGNLSMELYRFEPDGI